METNTVSTDIATKTNPELSVYLVLYRNNNILPLDAPFGFRCYAEDSDHAEEQCLDAEPDADIVWVTETEDYQTALEEYWDV